MQHIWNHTNAKPKVKLFNEALSNIFKNFFPSKLKTVDDRDPSWLTQKITKLLKGKSNMDTALKMDKDRIL